MMMAMRSVLLVVALATPGFALDDSKLNLVELAEKLNLTRFVANAKEAGVDRIINHEGK